MYYAKVIAHSINPAGVELISIECSYPLVGSHWDHLRHRAKSFSVASNRAIPTRDYIQRVIDDPAQPFTWGKNQSGMVAREQMTGWRKWLASRLWVGSRWLMIPIAWVCWKLGAHKEIVNWLLTPWAWTTLIVTATDWSNFFALRCHPDARPEIRHAAELMRDAIAKSMPVKLEAGEWHLPYVTENERAEVRNVFADKAKANDVLARMSAARCARVSLVKQDVRYGNGIELEKANTLQKSGHMSPFEHPCEALADDRRVANLRGYRSYRSTIPHEHDFGKLQNPEAT